MADRAGRIQIFEHTIEICQNDPDLLLSICNSKEKQKIYWEEDLLLRRVKDMVGNYKVITLCGSTRFRDAFMEAQKRLTLEGNIVISVGLFGHAGDDEVWKPGTKEMLDDMHKRKIDMADEIYVIAA